MTLLIDPRIVRLATLGFWLALIGASVMALLPNPPDTPFDRLGDKFAHMAAFMTLSGLAMIAYGTEARWKIVGRLLFVGAMIEVMQTIPMLHRVGDVTDWMVDAFGVLVVVMLFSILIPRREPATG